MVCKNAKGENRIVCAASNAILVWYAFTLGIMIKEIDRVHIEFIINEP